MDGPSRSSWLSALDAVRVVQRDNPDLDLRALASELFSVAEALTAQQKLRRALADSSRDAGPKKALARQLLGSRISPQAMSVVESVVSQRWTQPQDLVDAMERVGIDSVLAAAEREGNLDRVEEELFRFERTVSGDHDLRMALRDGQAPKEGRAELIIKLLGGKADRDTVWLAQRPVLHPRGRRYAAAIWRQLDIAGRRRAQITAVVTSAIPLDDTQVSRLEESLTRIYERPVNVQTIVDPALVGGVHIRVGDEVIDGTIARRIEDARALMGVSKKELRSG